MINDRVMMSLWAFAFGLLGSALLSWMLGFPPPPASIHGYVIYPQLVLSLFVVILCVVINILKSGGGPPTRPA
jgi:hypothetical protein